jgi:FixJ family two-component response regulator
MSPPLEPTVHVVDDDESMRSAIRRLLEAAGHKTRGYSSGYEFMLNSSDYGPGCLILDICLPGPNGFELHDALRREKVTLPVVFLTGHGDIPMTVRAMKAGAADFLTKPVEQQHLLSAVNNALQRDAAVRRASECMRVLREHYALLTPRERDVYSRVIEGKLNKQIAADLGAAERTIKAHRAHIMHKMRAGSVAELVRQSEHLHADSLLNG